jgi:hypothetical protein
MWRIVESYLFVCIYAVLGTVLRLLLPMTLLSIITMIVIILVITKLFDFCSLMWKLEAKRRERRKKENNNNKSLLQNIEPGKMNYLQNIEPGKMNRYPHQSSPLEREEKRSGLSKKPVRRKRVDS